MDSKPVRHGLRLESDWTYKSVEVRVLCYPLFDKISRIKITMNKIEKELLSKGWIDTRIEKNISCPAWPEKHVRVTMWDSNKPTYRHGILGYRQYGYDYASGDGATITEAFEHLKRNIEKGYCKFFPENYDNPVEKDYKNWKNSHNKKITKKKSKIK